MAISIDQMMPVYALREAGMEQGIQVWHAQQSWSMLFTPMKTGFLLRFIWGERSHHAHPRRRSPVITMTPLLLFIIRHNPDNLVHAMQVTGPMIIIMLWRQPARNIIGCW